MKKLLFGLLVLGSVCASAANTASLEYSCELDGVTRAGKVEIDDQLIVGDPSCMFFGKGPTFCLRFERHVKISDIHLALRTTDQLRLALDSNFIRLSNAAYSEGATSVNKVKVNLLKKEELSCTYYNINWN